MTVEKSIIYGLLGPSGCGKTTLLSCIVGRRKLDSGDIWVLGGKPGEPGSGVPGPRVGYMPQEIALVGEFTVRDAVYYFARIYGMTARRMEERFELLSDLLELPPSGQYVKNLSGGQQRRVSLAAALVHEPELLILDEPTVGLDPVLREKIWSFLTEVAAEGTAVIITTHYIDETKQAHKIGLLRDGQLLAEGAPDDILRRFDARTLEEAFFKMAMRQHEGRAIDSPPALPKETPTLPLQYQSQDTLNGLTSTSTDVLTPKEKPVLRSKSSGRYNATFIKSIQQFGRHPGGLIFSLLFPFVEVVCLFMAVGHDPRDLDLAVVNEEAALTPVGYDICANKSAAYVVPSEWSCDTHLLSCWFLEEMEKRNLLAIPYNTTAEAKNAVAKRKIYGAVHFPRNFSSSLAMRVAEGRVEDDVVDDSTISIWIDFTDQQISQFLKTQLYKTYEEFARRSMLACGKHEHLVQMPVHFETPIYGIMDAQLLDYMAPGILITLIYFMPTLITSTLMISDRLEGVWERSAVAGVRAHEMLYVHVGIQTVVLAIQTIETVGLAYGAFSLPSQGSLALCGLLLFTQGLGGMCFGFLLSVYCGSYTLSFFTATGSFYPMILLCGILWPLEGMPYALQVFAQCLPFTIPARSLRDVMTKGSTLTSPEVYYGLLVTALWIFIMLGMCLLKLKLRKT
ncbi:ABC transporter G family member 20 isoform X2 [Aricia agestis]|uniref:ABC transporter G family member 20 isoform X2 n=1 Tax=Aricia agestis TaxID=91739 RepID=UPI001C2041D6|nr:ABC transporter G family member 20 isoform X2 [Aricia agestis]